MTLPPHVVAAIAQLPDHLREHLAQGPAVTDLHDLIHGQLACTVCHAVLPLAAALINGGHGQSSTHWHIQAHAALVVFDWHQAILPDSCAYEPRLTCGRAAYARCLAIYRACGWTPA